MPLAPHRDVSFTSLAFDEWWDLDDRLAAILAQRERLETLLLAWARVSGATRLGSPRGALRVERYTEARVWNLPALLPHIRPQRYHEVLRVDGRRLWKEAEHDAALQAALRAHATPMPREGLAVARRARTVSGRV